MIPLLKNVDYSPHPIIQTATGTYQSFSPVWHQNAVLFVGVFKVRQEIDIGFANVAITMKCKFSASIRNKILFK